MSLLHYKKCKPKGGTNNIIIADQRLRRKGETSETDRVNGTHLTTVGLINDVEQAV